MSVLDSCEWSGEARRLMDQIHTLQQGTNAMLFIRHSHRLDGTSWEEIRQLRLTDEGKKAAEEFGAKLPLDKQFRLYYSPIERCKETAECFSKGIQNAHGTVQTIEELKILGEYLGNGNGIGQLFVRDRKQFVNFWAANHYDPQIIEPLMNYSKRTAEITWKLHKTATQPTMDIFVTHDTTILGLEFGWCGLLRNTFEDWCGFMGGFVLQLKTEKITMLTQGKAFECHYPYWNPIRN